MTSKKANHRTYSVRKTSGKVLSSTLYTYVRRSNSDWVRMESRKIGIPYSVFVDRLLTHVRTGQKRPFKVA